MKILGISPAAHETAAALVVDGKVAAACSEERFSRCKNQGGFPRASIAALLQIANLKASDIDLIALPWLSPGQESMSALVSYVREVLPSLFFSYSWQSRLRHFANFSRNMLSPRRHFGIWQETAHLKQQLRDLGLTQSLQFVDHQLSHIASAYYCSGFSQALGVSLDGYGSGAAGSFYLCQDGKTQLLQKIPYPHSLGTFYRRVTQALGFKPNRHEGKIVGLAAYGDAQKLHGEVVAQFDLRGEDFFRSPVSQDPWSARELAKNHPREHVAAAYQVVLEEVASTYIQKYLEKYALKHVVMAGGVFANVKMNQRIFEIPGVDKIFIFPAMGDSGTAVGAALYAQAQKAGLEPYRLQDVYWGPSYGDAEIERALKAFGLTFQRSTNVEQETAKLLAAGKVVGRFFGAMEFGPRALGNRSILCQAIDPGINKWLNDRLKRTEFMPFAPICLADHADELFESLPQGAYAAEFMTVTFNCTDKMKKEAPAAVHVDGTARPQLVYESRNPSLYKILKYYFELSGLTTLINTSFNMHEEPIVCSPEHAIRGFLDGGLDYLSIGSFIAQRS